MDIKLNSTQIKEAVEFYLAFKGYTASKLNFKMSYTDLNVTVKDIKKAKFNESGLLMNIKKDLF